MQASRMRMMMMADDDDDDDDDLFDNDNNNDNNLNKWVRETGTPGIITLLQKACLLGPERNIAKNPKQLRLWVIA